MVDDNNPYSAPPTVRRKSQSGVSTRRVLYVTCWGGVLTCLITGQVTLLFAFNAAILVFVFHDILTLVRSYVSPSPVALALLRPFLGLTVGVIGGVLVAMGMSAVMNELFDVVWHPVVPYLLVGGLVFVTGLAVFAMRFVSASPPRANDESSSPAS